MGTSNPSRKKTLYNALMIVAIVVIVGGAVAFAGSLRGWFSPSQEFAKAEYPSVQLVAQNKVGNVNIERAGFVYALDNGNKIQDGDVIATLTGSSVEISYGDLAEAIDERCEVLVHIDEDNKVRFEYINVPSSGSDGANQDASGGQNNPSVEGIVLGAGAVSGAGSSSSAGNAGNPSSAGDAGDTGSASSNGGNHASGSQNSGGSNAVSGAEGASGGGAATNAPTSKSQCTIAIYCSTILDNLGNLREGKERFVPANGVILAPSIVSIEEGETVFDVLKRVCAAAGIPLEYSFTPLYGSYYIEGIGHIYEFDCGNESGWMYQVNGWYPNYGCSSYEVKNGDSIVWNYTCNGYGADLGAPMN